MIAVRCGSLLAAIVLLGVSAVAAASDETLARAKELYRSASYDEALVVLDQVAHDSAGSLRVEASEYRLFCLIALDRKIDARVAIESMVSNDPFYQLATDQASPRVRTMFKDIRQSLLPGLVQREYASAKAAFDRQDPETAAQFERVLTLLDDPMLPASPAWTDLRTIAAGFRDLSTVRAQKAAAVPPVVAAAPASPPTPALAASAAPDETTAAASASPEQRSVRLQADQPAVPPAPVVPGPAIYHEGDADVIPPVTVKQTVPQWVVPNGTRAGAWQPEAVLEIVIDENGDVASAKLRKPFHPSYDQQLIKAALAWKYQPARKAGTPVRYAKNVAIRLGPVN
jgi:TonB family protein